MVQGDFDIREVFEVPLIITIGAELSQLIDLLSNMRMTLYQKCEDKYLLVASPHAVKSFPLSWN